MSTAMTMPLERDAWEGHGGHDDDDRPTFGDGVSNRSAGSMAQATASSKSSR